MTPRERVVEPRVPPNTPEGPRPSKGVKKRGLSGGTLLAAFAVVAMASGMIGAYASAQIAQQNVNASASQYGVSTSSSANFPTAPSVLITSTPTGTVSCTTSPLSWTPTSYANVVVSGNNTSCGAGHYAIEFSFSGNAPIVGENDIFTVYTSFHDGTGAAHSTTATFTVASASGTNAANNGINYFVDFGAGAPPTQVNSLTIVVT